MADSISTPKAAEKTSQVASAIAAIGNADAISEDELAALQNAIGGLLKRMK